MDSRSYWPHLNTMTMPCAWWPPLASMTAPCAYTLTPAGETALDSTEGTAP